MPTILKSSTLAGEEGSNHCNLLDGAPSNKTVQRLRDLSVHLANPPPPRLPAEKMEAFSAIECYEEGLRHRQRAQSVGNKPSVILPRGFLPLGLVQLVAKSSEDEPNMGESIRTTWQNADR